MPNAIAIIPARGGSKRIPRKNIKPFLGFPIIKYSIDAAIKAGCFEEVMVSTDDKEIADIGLSFGAKIPFMRSEKTSDDMAMTADVIIEVVNEYKKQGKEFDYGCCIYPTAPFLDAHKLREGFDKLVQTNEDAAVPVVKFGYPIQRALKIENDRVSMILPENYNKRSQDLMPAYHDVGQFYWFKISKFLETKILLPESAIPIILPESEVQDIDTEEDWKIAELKYKILKAV